MTTLKPSLPPETPHPRSHLRPQISDAIPSSSPAFATPAHPIRTKPPANISNGLATTSSASVLPISLPGPTLRPIAFRTFTKKHNLNLTGPALQALAAFVGKHCGAAWREDGLAEPVLDEIAKSWKRLYSTPIVDRTDGLKAILKQLEESMSGGKIIGSTKNALGRQASWLSNDGSNTPAGLHRQDSFGMTALDVDDVDEQQLDLPEYSDPRAWLKVVNAFDQPRLVYNAATKHFEKSRSQPSFFPGPAQKTELFRQRYHLIHQRVLRNESFQAPSAANTGRAQWKITSIANLLGRSGSGHLLLGLLKVTPTGTLAINDLTGSIHLDLEQATSIDLVQTWLCPGMIVLVDGVYEEQHNSSGASLGTVGGIGGTIGGRFIAFSIGAPRCETRAATLGITESHNVSSTDLTIGGGFGWTDFLGLGSEKAVGSRMRKIEHRLFSKHFKDRPNSSKVVLIGECNLDNPQTLSALRSIFDYYSSKTHSSSSSDPAIPLAFVLYGNFTTYAAMSSTSSHSASASSNSSNTATSASIPDSILYKESFDSLALLLADYPALLASSTWIFVPGDNDAWSSSFSAGASTLLPRQPVPEMFTSRVRRAFNTANSTTAITALPNGEVAAGKKPKGEVVFTSNPSRLSLFGPSCEMVLFRDDISSRMHRNAIPLKTRQDEQAEPTEHPQSNSEADVVMSGALSAPSPPPGDHTPQPPDEETRIDLEETQQTNTSTIDSASDSQNQQSAQEPTHQPSPPTPLQLQAQSLVKTLLDQHTLSPFPLNIRPVHWSFALSALSLYPLPGSLVLCDAGMDPWVVRYQGVEVLNTGRVCGGSSSVSTVAADGREAGGAAGLGKRRANLAGAERSGGAAAAAGGASGVRAMWVEFDVLTRRGAVRTA